MTETRQLMRLIARGCHGPARGGPGGDVAPHRSFDPRRVGRLECAAWVAYYRRDWPRFLRDAVGLTRHTFGLPWAIDAVRSRETFDPGRAATLDVEWWHVHREHQHHDTADGESTLIDALTALYAYHYAVPETEVRVAAAQRALAMRHSDQWVADVCDLASPLIAEERTALVRSYAGLLAAVHRIPAT